MTKAALKAEVEALKRSNSALKGQITKLGNAVPSGEMPLAVHDLVAAIDACGLAGQVGNHGEVAAVRDLL